MIIWVGEFKYDECDLFAFAATSRQEIEQTLLVSLVPENLASDSEGDYWGLLEEWNDSVINARVMIAVHHESDVSEHMDLWSANYFAFDSEIGERVRRFTPDT